VREWTNPEGKVVYFNSLVAWKIEGEGSGSGSSASKANYGAEPPDELVTGDDMPF
jgi:hypothetical protein